MSRDVATAIVEVAVDPPTAFEVFTEEVAAQSRKICRQTWPHIGLAIREQHDAIEPLCVLELAHLARAFHDAGVDRRVAAHADLAYALGEHGAVGDRLRRNEDVDLVVDPKR